MQISKAFLVVCTAICCASSISLAAPDTPSQAQAREALRKKMAELNAQDSAPKETKIQKLKTPPAPAPQPVIQPPPAAVATPAPTATAAPPMTVVTPPKAAPATQMSTEEANHLREALRQKIAELDAQTKTVTPAPFAVKPPPAVKSAERKPDAMQAEKAAVDAEQKRLADDAKAKQKAAEEQERAAAEARAKRAKSDRPKTKVATQARVVEFAPLPSPPPAVPASKEAKLDDLLRKYKADQITAVEYHKARAQILAEP